MCYWILIKKKITYYEMKTGTCFLRKAAWGKNKLKCISCEGTSIYNPLQTTTQGRRKEKDRENVILNIAPSSFLQSEMILLTIIFSCLDTAVFSNTRIVCRQADSTFSEV